MTAQERPGRLDEYYVKLRFVFRRPSRRRTHLADALLIVGVRRKALRTCTMLHHCRTSASASASDDNPETTNTRVGQFRLFAHISVHDSPAPFK